MHNHAVAWCDNIEMAVLIIWLCLFTCSSGGSISRSNMPYMDDSEGMVRSMLDSRPPVRLIDD